MTRTNSPAFLAILLLGALAVRLLSPVGFMPEWDNGSVAIVVCPDQAPPMAMTHGGHEGHKQGPAAKGAFCDFAGMDHDGAVPTAWPPAIESIDLRPAFAAAFDFEYLPAFTRWLRPPMRGPPSA